MKSNLDFDKYQKLLKAVGSMSGLFSNNEIPLFHPRFIEKLFVLTADAKDLARIDMSFDASIANDIGVGIKTFGTTNLKKDKVEKIAEFAKSGTLGELDNLNQEDLAFKAARLRNMRVQSDTKEHGINLDKSFYHCLVRSKGVAMIHEEPYELINIDGIKPLNSYGKEIAKFENDFTGHTYFTDGKSKYAFNRSKSVLLKRFELSKNCNSNLINIDIYDDIFTRILSWLSNETKSLVIDDQPKEDFVVLPLYGFKNKQRFIFEKSGINSWNAKDDKRPRKFGEAYIRVTEDVKKLKPGFFPSRDYKFQLKLPNGKVVSAKICQDGDKALMSDPNIDLCTWLYELIDIDIKVSHKRYAEKKPYRYSDLELIGKDSVKVIKKDNDLFEMAMMPIGSYEKFINDDDFYDDEYEAD